MFNGAADEIFTRISSSFTCGNQSGGGGVERFRLKRRTEPFSSGHGLRVYSSLRFLDARIGHFVRAARLLTGEQMDTVEPTYRGFTAKIIPRVT